MNDITKIHKIIRNLMYNNDIDAIDFILKHVDVDSFSVDSIDVALSFLTATAPIKTKLENRINLINYIEDYGQNVRQLLEGLR